ncbi:thioredoxin [Candidatus Bathyarchaeota archaeon]|nr:MAG: thioredoxin [Candidatus Bathyarchaeota archaeon]
MQKLEKSRQLSQRVETLSKPVDVGDEDFGDFVGRFRFVVVDFWASWCPPCRIIAPIIEKLAKQYAGKIVFAKVNVDQNPKTALAYGVTSIPTLIFIKNGVEVDRIIGAVPEEVIKSTINKHLT